MKVISEKQRKKIYDMVHDEVVNARTELRLSATQDYRLAQITRKICARMDDILGIER